MNSYLLEEVERGREEVIREVEYMAKKGHPTFKKMLEDIRKAPSQINFLDK